MGDAIAKNIADAGQKRRGTCGKALLDTGAFSYMLLAAAAAAAADDDDDDGGGAGGGMQRRHRGIFKKHKDQKPNTPSTTLFFRYNKKAVLNKQPMPKQGSVRQLAVAFQFFKTYGDLVSLSQRYLGLRGLGASHSETSRLSV